MCLDIEVVRHANPVMLEDGNWKFVVVPFLCKAEKRNVRMNGEHDDFRWVSLEELKDYDMIHYTEEARLPSLTIPQGKSQAQG